jgi:DNA-binding NarL/FixJ family response regulator
MTALRILVADDHEIVRRGLCAILGSHAGWEVCGEAADGREVVEKSRQLRPDIVILDIGMPSLNGLDATRQILRNDPEQRILILTITDAEQVIEEVLRAGARGFVLKADAAQDLTMAVEALQQGRTFFNSRAGEMVLNGFLGGGEQVSKKGILPRLTAREREVVQLLAEGKSTKEVAVMLDLSVKTAETHRSNIMRKLGVHCLSELVLYAVRNRIVQVAEPIPEYHGAQQMGEDAAMPTTAQVPLIN